MAAEASPTPPQPRTRGAIARILISGVLVGLPIGILLAYLAILPFYLGLFFFLLLGLMIGAVMYRFGRGAAPLPRSQLLWAGGLVVTLVWGSGLVVDYVVLPYYVAKELAEDRRRLSDADRQQLLEGSRVQIHQKLDKGYPPGGFIGYLRWAAASGTMEIASPIGEAVYTFKLPQTGFSWVFRVVVSLGLLAFSVLSQVLGLAVPPEQPEESPSPAETESGSRDAP